MTRQRPASARTVSLLFLLAAALLALAGCGAQDPETPAVVAPPPHPPGDSTDTGVWIRVRNATTGESCRYCECRGIDIAQFVYQFPHSPKTVVFGPLAPGSQTGYVRVRGAYAFSGFDVTFVVDGDSIFDSRRPSGSPGPMLEDGAYTYEVRGRLQLCRGWTEDLWYNVVLLVDS